MPLVKSPKRLYLVPVLSKALDILELLRDGREALSLEAIHRTTRISKTTAYRVLRTFVHRGYVARGSDGLYRVLSKQNKLLFGFAAQSADMPFSMAVTQSLQEAAQAAGVELMVLDNAYDEATAIRNAEEFVSAKVDLVIEFQIEQKIAPVIADKIAGAGIPMIAIEIPHPRAIFFGVDNYRMGYDVGELLGKRAVQNWKGEADWILGLDIPEAGQIVQSRITGAFEGIKAVMPDVPVEYFVRIDGRGKRDSSRKAVYEFLKRHPKSAHILIAAANDTSALGALDAARELGREKQVMIAGHDAIPEALQELRKAKSVLIATTAHHTQNYGGEVLRLALAILDGDTVPPYNYVEHELITRKSLPPASRRNNAVT
ncbi:substrate-binding domain-containing protein [Terriglobus sp. RCC_193]|uniref:substrate-binding domain-containing protein n=1 Tax=Terriglobus sp. RCC_193 TaxID=3239218 RepID=UPI003523F5A8